MSPPFPKCHVTGKIVFKDKSFAELVADEIALKNWGRGADTWMTVYPCEHCQGLHVGTWRSRPRVDWRDPQHPYKHLKGPKWPKNLNRAGNVT